MFLRLSSRLVASNALIVVAALLSPLLSTPSNLSAVLIDKTRQLQ
jgi:hypothetical protein